MGKNSGNGNGVCRSLGAKTIKEIAKMLFFVYHLLYNKDFWPIALKNSVSSKLR